MSDKSCSINCLRDHCKECGGHRPVIGGIVSQLCRVICIDCAIKPSQECVDEFTKFATNIRQEGEGKR